MRRKAIKAEELGEHNASSNLCQDEGMLRKRLGMRWSAIFFLLLFSDLIPEGVF